MKTKLIYFKIMAAVFFFFGAFLLTFEGHSSAKLPPFFHQETIPFSAHPCDVSNYF